MKRRNTLIQIPERKKIADILFGEKWENIGFSKTK
jgi:hypothetical protein